MLSNLITLRNSFANNHIAKYKAFEEIIQTIKEYNLDINAAESISIDELRTNYQSLGEYALATYLSTNYTLNSNLNYLVTELSSNYVKPNGVTNALENTLSSYAKSPNFIEYAEVDNYNQFSDLVTSS